MEKFSLEYIFLECNVHGHCLGAELKLPIIRNGIQYDELFIRNVILSEEEEKLLIKNVTRTINTNSIKIKVLAFVNGQNPFEANEYAIETDNIKAINRIR